MKKAKAEEQRGMKKGKLGNIMLKRLLATGMNKDIRFKKDRSLNKNRENSEDHRDRGEISKDEVRHTFSLEW